VSGESGVAGEGRVVGVRKFHSWGKCNIALTNINSDWMCNASSGLCINLHYIKYLRRSFILHLAAVSAGLCAKNAGGAYARGGAYLRDTTVIV